MNMFWEEESFIQARNFHSKISKSEIHYINNGNRLIAINPESSSQETLLSVESKIIDDACGDNVCVVSNGYHTVILKTDGTVWAKGRNMYCQCGQKDLTMDVQYFTKVEGLADIIQVSCGTHHSVALDKQGRVWRWGTIHNTLVSPTWDNLPHSLPYIVESLSNIIWVECGQEFFYALDNKGVLWGYGSNYYGSLGSSANVFTEKPVEVFNNFFNVTSVYVCFKEAYAITREHELLRWTFGREDGDNRIVLNCSKPIIVEQPVNVVALSTSSLTAIALTEQGVLWTWGDNFNANLGYLREFDIDDTVFFQPGKIEAIPLNPYCVGAFGGGVIAQYDNDMLWGWGPRFHSTSPIKILPALDLSSQTEILPRTAYSNNYVAFLDILGFKNLVQGQYGEHSSMIVKSKLDFLSEIGEHFKRFDANVMLMSDSIVVSLKKQVPDALFKFLYIVAQISGMLNGSVLRGAISFGELYHKRNIVFGPAFIEAYQLQEYTAIYPRIIIKPSNIKPICDISEQNRLTMEQYFLLDDDNEIFFDYLSLLKDAETLHIGFELNTVVSGITNAILINFLSCQTTLNEKIVKKYEWLLKYIFIWQIRNLNIYNKLNFFKFRMLYFYNQDNIEDLQSCRPVFKQKIVIVCKDYVLLENGGSFPENVPSHQNHNAFIARVKKAFCCDVKINSPMSLDIFNSIGVEIFWNRYEKRPVLNMIQYTLWNVDSLKNVEENTHHWMSIMDLTERQKTILNSLLQYGNE